MVILEIFIFVFFMVLFREFLVISFDETFSTIRNVPVDWLYCLMLIFNGFTVVMMMCVVGLIMVIALLTIPAGISTLLFKNVKKIMTFSIIFGIIFNIQGLGLSYILKLTSGATIILIGGFI